MKKQNIFWGVIFILLGITILVNRFFNFNFFSISNMWPIIILVLGLLFEFDYFVSKRNAGILVPGGILTTLGILFFFETFTNWTYSEYTWPIYILAVSLGLFQFYLFGNKNKGVLFSSTLLFLIALLSFLSMIYNTWFSWIKFNLIIPILFILIGVYILFRGSFLKK